MSSAGFLSYRKPHIPAILTETLIHGYLCVNLLNLIYAIEKIPAAGAGVTAQLLMENGFTCVAVEDL